MKHYGLFSLWMTLLLALFTGCSKDEAPVEPTPQNKSFTLTLEKVTSTTIVIDVTPVDKNQPYVLLLGNRDYLEEHNLLGDDAALIADDLAFFENFANGMGGGMITPGQAMSGFMYVGDLDNHTWSSVNRNYEYVVYVYGFDTEKMQPTTEVCYLDIKTPDVEYYVLDFNFDIQVEGPMFSATIEPVNYSGPYFFGVFLAEDVPPGTDPDLVRSYCEAAWEEEKGTYASFAETQEELLHFLFNDVAYKGKTYFPSKDGMIELTANTKYVLWAFGMNSEALLNTEPVLEYFETGAPKDSDNTFTLAVDNIKSRKATVTVTPSNSDEYVALVQPVSRFAGMTDEEILQEVCSQFTLNPISGVQSSVATDLDPETDYLLMAFGVSGGMPTTALYKKPFRTLQATPSAAPFELKFDAFYDVAEVAQLLPDWSQLVGQVDLLLPIEVETNEQVKEVYYQVLLKSDYEQWPEQTLVRMIKQEGAGVLTGDLFQLNYDRDFCLLGFGIDQEGDYTPLKVYECNFKKEDRSPAADFVTWVEEHSSEE